jgi:stringent starvation protein B
VAQVPSTKPYLLRAICEWCADSGFTPHVVVAVDSATRVPRRFVQDGQITLNIGGEATSGLVIDNEFLRCSARFAGVAEELCIPVARVTAIYARENGLGMGFPVDEPDGRDPDPIGGKQGGSASAGGKPVAAARPKGLKRVK